MVDFHENQFVLCPRGQRSTVFYYSGRVEIGSGPHPFLYAFYSHVRVLLFCSRHFPCIFVFLVCCYHLIGRRSFTPVVRFWGTLIVALGDPPRWAIVDLVLWAGWVTVRNGWWFGRHRVSDRRDGEPDNPRMRHYRRAGGSLRLRSWRWLAYR